MSEQNEALNEQSMVRGILKPIQEAGVGVVIENGSVTLKLSDGVLITPDQDKSLTNYMNRIAPELSGVNAKSAGGVIGALEKFQADPAYAKDIIMYGPSLEDDFAAKRMERLASVRQAVTEAQMNSQPGPERVQAVKVATFARTHLPDLGLNTTINYLKALR